MQLPGKLMDQTWKNYKKLILDLILAHLAQIWIPNFFFASFTSTSSHPMQFKEKLINHT